MFIQKSLEGRQVETRMAQGVTISAREQRRSAMSEKARQEVALEKGDFRSMLGYRRAL